MTTTYSGNYQLPIAIVPNVTWDDVAQTYTLSIDVVSDGSTRRVWTSKLVNPMPPENTAGLQLVEFPVQIPQQALTLDDNENGIANVSAQGGSIAGYLRVNRATGEPIAFQIEVTAFDLTYIFAQHTIPVTRTI